MATLDDLRSFGYTVTELDERVHVAGYGREWWLEPDSQDVIDRIAAFVREDQIRARLLLAVDQLKTATDAIAAGQLFSSLTTQERNYLRLLGRVANGLCRLELAELGADE